MYVLVPFTVQNIRKMLKVDPELLRTVIFGPILGPILDRLPPHRSSSNKES